MKERGTQPGIQVERGRQRKRQAGVVAIAAAAMTLAGCRFQLGGEHSSASPTPKGPVAYGPAGKMEQAADTLAVGYKCKVEGITSDGKAVKVNFERTDAAAKVMDEYGGKLIVRASSPLVIATSEAYLKAFPSMHTPNFLAADYSFGEADTLSDRPDFDMAAVPMDQKNHEGSRTIVLSAGRMGGSIVHLKPTTGVYDVTASLYAEALDGHHEHDAVGVVPCGSILREGGVGWEKGDGFSTLHLQPRVLYSELAPESTLESWFGEPHPTPSPTPHHTK